MKHSRQRDLIMKVLTENPCHPTAEKVFALVRQYDASISLATVYRNLNQLAENKIIKKLERIDNVAHFDHSLHQHYHFVCSKCSKIIDVDTNAIPDLIQKLSGCTGLAVENADITLQGICPACLNKIQSNFNKE